MHLKSLVLHNFGPYGDRQTLRFAQPSKRQPITLIGGMNGHGKTTLLDALQLALYGKLAQCSNRNGLSYPEFLRRSIHRSEHVVDGAAVELSFEVHGHDYRVNRRWASLNGSTSETCEVFVDEWPDSALSQRWLEVVETILPNRIAPLLFFDGERIEELANPETAPSMIRQAVHSLLGLEIVDKLIGDLRVLEGRRLRSMARSEEDDTGFERIRGELGALSDKRERATYELAQAKAQHARLEGILAELDQRFEREGGQLWLDLRGTEAEIERQHEALERIQDEMRRLAEGVLPLALVRSKLLELRDVAEKAEQRERDQSALQILEGRDRELLGFLLKLGMDGRSAGRVSEWLAQDRSRLRGDQTRAGYSLPRGLVGRLDAVLSHEVDEAVARAGQLSDELEQCQVGLRDLEAKRASTPDEASVRAICAERLRKSAELEELRSGIARLNIDIEVSRREEERLNRQLAKELEEIAANRHTQRESARVLKHSSRARTTLGNFRDASLRHNLARLSKEISEAFIRLNGKGALFGEIAIDPETFRVTIARRGRGVCAADRLSAGERQLLAVATVWGLTRCARGSLPVVIDTPLGRLDSVHRMRLADVYFPNAAEQVILLSTDEEIDEQLLYRLAPAVGRAYSLSFNESRQSSAISEGYLWEVPHEAAG